MPAKRCRKGGTLTIPNSRVVGSTRTKPAYVAWSSIYRAGPDGRTLRGFQSVRHTTKPTGTGLGLAIVVLVVETHRGKVKIKSRPRAGDDGSRLCCRVNNRRLKMEVNWETRGTQFHWTTRPYPRVAFCCDHLQPDYGLVFNSGRLLYMAMK